jgi:hypothetical protein
MVSSNYTNLKISLIALILVIVAIALIIGAITFFLRNRSPEALLPDTATPTPTFEEPQFTQTPSPLFSPTPTPTLAVFPTPTPRAVDFSAPLQVPTGNSPDWITYTSTKHHLSIKYPENAKITVTNNEVFLTLFDNNQKGVNLIVSSSNLSNDDLENVVNKDKNSLNQDTSNIHTLKLANHSGFYFHSIQKPIEEYYYLQIDNNSYLKIVNKTTDPDNIGYEEVLNKIFSSIKII